MPRRRRLSDAQLDGLLALATEEKDIIRHYTLSEGEIASINRRHRPQNRLGFALQLCGLRYPGRLLRRSELVPERMLTYVAHQLDAQPNDLLLYAERFQTPEHIVIPEVTPARNEARRTGRHHLARVGGIILEPSTGELRVRKADLSYTRVTLIAARWSAFA